MASKTAIHSQTAQPTQLLHSFEAAMAGMDSPAKLIYGFLLILIIVYSSVIPSEYRVFADSLLGRVFGIGIVYGVIQSMGWVYGLITAMAFVLLLTGAPRLSMMEAFVNQGEGSNPLREGFDGGGTVSEKQISGKRWFVEKVLGENPSKIAVDRVTTLAPSD